MAAFSEETRQQCAVYGIDIERSYAELLLEVRVGGPAYGRLATAVWKARDPSLIRHGTMYAYTWQGCRCLACRVETARAKRRQRLARKQRQEERWPTPMLENRAHTTARTATSPAG